jgi:hypothetical protein
VEKLAFCDPDLVLHRASEAESDHEGRVAHLVVGQCSPRELKPALCNAFEYQRFNVVDAVIHALKAGRTVDEELFCSTMEAGIKAAIKSRLWGKAALLVPFVPVRSCPDVFDKVISDYVEPSLPRDLVTALIARSPRNAEYSILLDYAFAARRMDAVDLVLESGAAERSRRYCREARVSVRDPRGGGAVGGSERGLGPREDHAALHDREIRRFA